MRICVAAVVAVCLLTSCREGEPSVDQDRRATTPPDTSPGDAAELADEPPESDSRLAVTQVAVEAWCDEVTTFAEVGQVMGPDYDDAEVQALEESFVALQAAAERIARPGDISLEQMRQMETCSTDAGPVLHAAGIEVS